MLFGEAGLLRQSQGIGEFFVRFHDPTLRLAHADRPHEIHRMRARALYSRVFYPRITVIVRYFPYIILIAIRWTGSLAIITYSYYYYYYYINIR